MIPAAARVCLFVSAAALCPTAVAQIAPVEIRPVGVVLASHEPSCDFPVPLPLPADISCSAPWTPRVREPLPYAFTWQSYRGAEVEHACYGPQRLPPTGDECCHPEPLFPLWHDWFDRLYVFLKAPIEGCRSKGCTVAVGPPDYADAGQQIMLPEAPIPASDPVWQAPAQSRPLVKATPVEVAPVEIPPASTTPPASPGKTPTVAAEPMPPVPSADPAIDPEFAEPAAPIPPATTRQPVVELAPEPALPQSAPPALPRNKIPQPNGALPSNQLPGR